MWVCTWRGLWESRTPPLFSLSISEGLAVWPRLALELSFFLPWFPQCYKCHAQIFSSSHLLALWDFCHVLLPWWSATFRPRSNKANLSWTGTSKNYEPRQTFSLCKLIILVFVMVKGCLLQCLDQVPLGCKMQIHANNTPFNITWVFNNHRKAGLGCWF